MLSENTYYSSLPDEGTPEEHEGSGGLHPEEVEGGPLIPEGWILDFRTRRLVPFVLPDDPDAGNLPAALPEDEVGDEDEGEEPEAAPPESFVERAQRAVREVMTMLPTWQPPVGWQEPEALLPPIHGARVHAHGLAPTACWTRLASAPRTRDFPSRGCCAAA